MNEQHPPLDSEDAAWVSFKTPLSSRELIDFCQDVYRLLRINPYLEFINWQQLSENCYHFEAVNNSSNPVITLKLNIEVKPLCDGICMIYSQGIKASTRFKVQQEIEGASLTIIDSYDAVSPSERKQRLNEVDKSLVKWAEDIQDYLVKWHRWSKISVWRWYMKHVWQPMKPSARRITYMLLWITLAEISLILLGASIYMIEY
ncbi:MAG: hypothetical protein OQL09_01930 [Gammaproteobacteria bacterium]|nr:hypothetical protein [Gammaproteobacteria bacterium]